MKIHWANWGAWERFVCRFFHGWKETTTEQQRQTNTRHFQCGRCGRQHWGWAEKPKSAARKAAWPLSPLASWKPNNAGERG